ncbi:MAG: tetratricopeptide repeat protein [Candidatus Lokiarchaeota archaeon]|nr:tetratricopeptide repeat protein [Candidatus Lokiarchaeota archaeon]
MDKKYIETNKIDFNTKIKLVFDVYDRMINAGMFDYSIINIDFTFFSNNKTKLNNLLDALKQEFSINDEVKYDKISENENLISLTINDIIMSRDLLVSLITYLFIFAQKHDCNIGDWGAFNSDVIYDKSLIQIESFLNEGYDLCVKGFYYKAFVKFYLVTLVDDNPNAYYNLGCIKKGWRIVEGAIKSYNKAIEYSKNNPHPAAYMNRGVAYFDLGKYQEAIDDYKKAIELAPNNPDLYLNIGNAYLALKDNDSAVKYYNKAIKLGSKDAIKIKELEGLE